MFGSMKNRVGNALIALVFTVQKIKIQIDPSARIRNYLGSNCDEMFEIKDTDKFHLSALANELAIIGVTAGLVVYVPDF